MFTTYPFAELSASIFPSVMQAYIAVTLVLAAVGTIYEALHTKIAWYSRENRQKSRYQRDRGAWELEQAPITNFVD